MNLSGSLFIGEDYFVNILPAPMNAEPLDCALLQNRIMAWVIILAEVFRGVIADLIWIGRGYDIVFYTVFIAIHLMIIGTGVLFLRQTKAE